MTVQPHNTIRELQTLYRTETHSRLARRIQAVWLARKGRTCPEIVDITGAKRRTIQQWISRYNRGGIEELLDKSRSGRPALLSTTSEKQLARRIEAGPTQADGVSVFTGPAVGALVKREFGILYSLRGIERLLGRLGFSYLAPRPRHEKADPQTQEEFKKTSLKGWRKSPLSIPANE